MLIERCQELQKQVEHWQRLHESSEKAHDSEREIFDRIANQLNDRTNAYTRLEGWRDCAREMLELRADAMVASLP